MSTWSCDNLCSRVCCCLLVGHRLPSCSQTVLYIACCKQGSHASSKVLEILLENLQDLESPGNYLQGPGLFYNQRVGTLCKVNSELCAANELLGQVTDMYIDSATDRSTDGRAYLLAVIVNCQLTCCIKWTFC